MTVGSENGHVSLGGRVGSWYARELAGWIALGVTGVRDIENRLTVDLERHRRSEDVAAEVRSRMAWDPLVDASDIVVQVQDGSVQLLGTVPSSAQKKQAEADAWLTGVWDVDGSELQISRVRADLLKGAAYTPSGFQIAMIVRDALAYDPRVSVADVHPLVSAGFVLLRGTVATLRAKIAAEDTTRHVSGVVEVTNLIEVRPRRARADSTLEQDVRNALSSCVLTRGQTIAASVRKGEVLLRGSVTTPIARKHATRLVASIEGVREVDNHLQIVPPAGAHPRYLGSRSAEQARTRSNLLGDVTVSDDELIANVRRRLATNELLAGSAVSPHVLRGIATLNGTAQDTSQRMAASRSAYEAGVVFVDNRMTVNGVD